MVCVVVVAVASYVPPGHIAPGVRMGALDLSGQSQESAHAAVQTYADDAEKHVFVLKFAPPTRFGKEHFWHFTAKELGLGVDVAQTVSKGLEVAQGSAVTRAARKLGGQSEPRQIEASPSIDLEALDAAVKGIAHSVHHAPKNAKIVVALDGTFKTSPGSNGLEVNVSASADAISHAWTELLSGGDAKASATPKEVTTNPEAHAKSEESAPTSGQSTSSEATQSQPVEVSLALSELQPAVNEETLSKIDGAIGEMKTRIRGTPQRVRNVTIATQHIDGTLIPAGGNFSYNQVVGKRSEEGGYQKATIFVKGRHVEDVGGGICQTASTLYNAVLRAGLHVVRRQSHCTPVVYVPYGLDATVAYGAVDFQFENDTEYPVYVYAKAKGRALTFRLYSKTEPTRKVVLEKLKQETKPTSTTIIQDRTLPPGKRVVKDKGALGYTIVWRRTITEEGKPVRSEIIRSHYKPVSSIVAIGPGGLSKHAPADHEPVPVPRKLPVQDDTHTAPVVSPGL